MKEIDKIEPTQIVLYRAGDQDVAVEAYLKDDTIWMTQKAISELFGINVPGISKHLTNIYNEGELDQTATVSKMEIVQKEGKRTVKRTQDFYNLDAIISVGYRVNSKQATQFRIWATKVLNELESKTK